MASRIRRCFGASAGPNAAQRDGGATAARTQRCAQRERQVHSERRAADQRFEFAAHASAAWKESRAPERAGRASRLLAAVLQPLILSRTMMRPSAFFVLSLACGVLAEAQASSAAPAPAPQPTQSAQLAPPPPASDEQRAATLRDTGNQAMLDMRYVDALSAYQQALALSPNYSGVLYSIARAHQLLGEFAEALTTLEAFDREATPEMRAKVGRLDRLLAELRARVGVLQLSCNVSGARVLLRDKVIGTTPLPPTRLEAGSATLEVELDGFFAQKKELIVPAGGSLALDLTLHARSTSALLVVHTNPGGAQISVDGRVQGTASPSVELALSAGPHRVTARREGFDDASVPLVLVAGSTRSLNVGLEKSIPLTSRWWFWTGAVAIVAGGVALSVAELTERSADKGTLTPGQISAPLRF